MINLQTIHGSGFFRITGHNRRKFIQCAPSSVAAVAQLVESRIVIPVVVGSSPISRPSYSHLLTGRITRNTENPELAAGFYIGRLENEFIRNSWCSAECLAG